MDGIRRDLSNPDKITAEVNSAFEERILDYATESGPAREVLLTGYLDTPLNKTGALLPSNIPISLSFIKANDNR